MQRLKEKGYIIITRLTLETLFIHSLFAKRKHLKVKRLNNDKRDIDCPNLSRLLPEDHRLIS
jgi:hypothetical protein